MKKIGQIASEIIAANQKNYGSILKVIACANKYNCFSFKVKDVKKEIERILALRDKRKTSKVILTEREITHERLFSKEKLNRIARSVPGTGHSMGYSVRVRVKHSEQDGFFSCAENYSKSSGYLATHGRICLHLSAKEAVNCDVIAGTVTIKDKKIKKDFWKVRFLVSEGIKQHHKIFFVDAYLYKDFHFTAKTGEEALQIYKNKKAVEIQRIANARAEDKIIALAQKIEMTRVFVTVQDSFNAGNCEPITYQFARKLGIDTVTTGAVRADFIYENRAGYESYVLKAINQARLRYAKTFFAS